MLADEALRRALKNLAETRQSKVNAVVAGSCDAGAYKLICGEIHGLDLAIDEIKAVLQKAEEEDGNDD